MEKLTLFRTDIGYIFVFVNTVIFMLSVIYFLSRANYNRAGNFMIINLGICLNCCFVVKNFFLFFFFFEVTIIPLVFLLGVWGARSRKLHALYQLVVFTVLSSLFLIISIIYVYSNSGSLYFDDFYFVYVDNDVLKLICFFLVLGLLVKVPSLPVHLWLPEAHVEAPTVASVVLASMILKVSYIGFYRSFPLYNNLFILEDLKPIFLTIFIISAMYCSIIAFRQIDIKKIVAYSSIVHMNFSLLGLWSLNQLGSLGCFLGMLSHCFVSAALFFSVGFLYDRFHIRNLLYYGGLVQYMPIFSILFFFTNLANMSFPLTAGFWSEIFVMINLFEISNIYTLFFNILSFLFVGIYCINMVNNIIFKTLTVFLRNNLFDLSFRETFILAVLLLFVFVTGFYPKIIFDLVT